MAYATNGFIRKHADKKVIVAFVLQDSEGMFDKFKHNECFVMTHVTNQAGSPMFVMNGESCSDSDWYEQVMKKQYEELEWEFDAERKKQDRNMYKGWTLSQLSTAAIWICKKVKEFF